jgi:hypothetical protein
LLGFYPIGSAGGDQSNLIASPGVDDYENSGHCIHADRDESFFVMALIFDRDGSIVFENGDGIGKSMPCFRRLRLALLGSH